MFPSVIPLSGTDCSRVTHPSAAKTNSQQADCLSPLDLHVLGTPPAFVLSQDQTLMFDLYQNFGSLIPSSALSSHTPMRSLPAPEGSTLSFFLTRSESDCCFFFSCSSLLYRFQGSLRSQAQAVWPFPSGAKCIIYHRYPFVNSFQS